MSRRTFQLSTGLWVLVAYPLSLAVIYVTKPYLDG
jgi:hypothetical protein